LAGLMMMAARLLFWVMTSFAGRWSGDSPKVKRN
jgi:hypothetical protein